LEGAPGSGEQEIRAEVLASYRGTFEEGFELHSFPFDVQPLHVKLNVEQDAGVEMECLKEDSALGRRMEHSWANNEWSYLDYKISKAHQHPLNHAGKGLTARLFVSCRVQRHARSYLIRIVGVVGLICLLSVCIFVIDPKNIQDMIGHSFMMLLTLTTYSLVVGDILPNLGYLTFMDSIVLIAFFFLTLVALQVTWIGWFFREEGFTRRLVSKSVNDEGGADDGSMDLEETMKDWGDFLRTSIELMLEEPIKTRLKFKYND